MARFDQKLTMLVLSLVCFGLLQTQGAQSDEKERLFKTAVSSYESGRYAEAVGPLEKLVGEVPENFEVQELLGLVYAAQSQQSKANVHLAAAVKLKPGSVAARSNPAGGYGGLGQLQLPLAQLLPPAALAPQ